MRTLTLTDILIYRRCPKLYEFSRLKHVEVPLPLLQFAAVLYRKAVKHIDDYLIRNQVVPMGRLTESFQTAWRKNRQWLKVDPADDYLEHQMMTTTRHSLSSYVTWIAALPRRSLVHSMITMDIRREQRIKIPESGSSSIKQPDEILFAHRFHAILRDVYGRFFILMHRFGPQSPEADHTDMAFLASSFVFWKATGDWPAGLLIYYPWHDQCLEVEINRKKSNLWFEETIPLINHILNSRSFQPHLGDHCSLCRYFEFCPAFHNNPPPIPIHSLHDPDTRCIDYYFQLSDQLITLGKNVELLKKYLLQYAKEKKTRILVSSNGEQALEVNDMGRLPRKGTIKRFGLEAKLKQHGYHGPMRASSIKTWLSKQRNIPSKDIHMIHHVLEPFIKIKKTRTPY